MTLNEKTNPKIMMTIIALSVIVIAAAFFFLAFNSKEMLPATIPTVETASINSKPESSSEQANVSPPIFIYHGESFWCDKYCDYRNGTEYKSLAKNTYSGKEVTIDNCLEFDQANGFHACKRCQDNQTDCDIKVTLNGLLLVTQNVGVEGKWHYYQFDDGWQNQSGSHVAIIDTTLYFSASVDRLLLVDVQTGKTRYLDDVVEFSWVGGDGAYQYKPLLDNPDYGKADSSTKREINMLTDEAGNYPKLLPEEIIEYQQGVF